MVPWNACGAAARKLGERGVNILAARTRAARTSSSTIDGRKTGWTGHLTRLLRMRHRLQVEQLLHQKHWIGRVAEGQASAGKPDCRVWGLCLCGARQHDPKLRPSLICRLRTDCEGLQDHDVTICTSGVHRLAFPLALSSRPWRCPVEDLRRIFRPGITLNHGEGRIPTNRVFLIWAVHGHPMVEKRRTTDRAEKAVNLHSTRE
jgi:hypothetical protein